MSREWEELISEIESIGDSREAQQHLIELAEHSDPSVRYAAISRLGNFADNGDVLRRVVASLGDEDDLVRIEALEILGDFGDEEHASVVRAALSDEDELVRGAAAVALGQIGTADSATVLRSRLLTTSGRERVSVLVGLWLLERDAHLPALLAMLTDPDYWARCATANFLAEHATSGNRTLIARHLETALSGEDTIAAADSIRNSLSRILMKFHSLSSKKWPPPARKFKTAPLKLRDGQTGKSIEETLVIPRLRSVSGSAAPSLALTRPFVWRANEAFSPLLSDSTIFGSGGLLDSVIISPQRYLSKWLWDLWQHRPAQWRLVRLKDRRWIDESETLLESLRRDFVTGEAAMRFGVLPEQSILVAFSQEDRRLVEDFLSLGP